MPKKQRYFARRKHNPQNPPRFKVVVMVREPLHKKLTYFAGEDAESKSRMINNLLCEAFDIPQKER